MKFVNFYKVLQILSFLITFACVPAAASDVDDLTAMLNEFLAAADKEPAHRRFWAEDLVYTSSNGTRVTKGEILADQDGRSVQPATGRINLASQHLRWATVEKQVMRTLIDD